MRGWRICRAAFANLRGEGARLFGGRWNSPGRAVIYTAENAALAVLEVRVHLDLEPDLIPDDYVLMEIEFGAVSFSEIDLIPPSPRTAGDAWLSEGRSAILRVPSFAAPASHNLLVNPAHAEAGEIAVAEIHAFSFDRRLWLPLS